MKTLNFKTQLGRILTAALMLTLFLGFYTQIHAQGAKNVVLVHGAFADGSGWKGVYNILTKKGYNVTVVQNALSSLEDDVAVTRLALDKQNGPTILVGHSWGGVVITEAGVHDKVVGLVYVAAYQPDKGETLIQWAQTAPPAPEGGLLPPDDKGIIYYDKAKYHAGFCADVSKADAEFMYASQGAFNVKCVTTPVTQAAWKTKPSYGVVATDDKSIVPSIQRTMYKRSNTIVTEVKGSHVVFMSQPDAVANVIITAATKAGK